MSERGINQSRCSRPSQHYDAPASRKGFGQETSGPPPPQIYGKSQPQKPDYPTSCCSRIASYAPFISVGTIYSLGKNTRFCTSLYSITFGSHVWLLLCAFCRVCGFRSWWFVGCLRYQLLREFLSYSIFWCCSSGCSVFGILTICVFKSNL
jgi:hypothetical protein